jgi:hypothetical protein
MSGVSVVESGNYDLQIATGFQVDAFTLDDPLKGLLNSTEYFLDGTTEFASVLDGTTQVTVKRGRRDIGDAFSTGTLTATLLDVEGIFNPFNQDSPYYDTPEAKPGLAPLRAVKMIRYDIADNPEELFNGYIVNYDYNFELGGLSTVTVYAADQFYLLSQTALDEHSVSAETSGERIETVLDFPKWTSRYSRETSTPAPSNSVTQAPTTSKPERMSSPTSHRSTSPLSSAECL